MAGSVNGLEIVDGRILGKTGGVREEGDAYRPVLGEHTRKFSKDDCFVKKQGITFAI